MNQSITFKLENGRIRGFLDPVESLKQTVRLTLKTERGKYNYVIPNLDFGVELEKLIGLNKLYVLPRLQYTIEQALLIDNRIDNIIDFKVTDISENKIAVEFTIITNLEEAKTLTFNEVFDLAY